MGSLRLTELKSAQPIDGVQKSSAAPTLRAAAIPRGSVFHVTSMYDDSAGSGEEPLVMFSSPFSKKSESSLSTVPDTSNPLAKSGHRSGTSTSASTLMASTAGGGNPLVKASIVQKRAKSVSDPFSLTPQSNSMKETATADGEVASEDIVVVEMANTQAAYAVTESAADQPAAGAPNPATFEEVPISNDDEAAEPTAGEIQINVKFSSKY